MEDQMAHLTIGHIQDPIRSGFSNLAVESSMRHPVEKLQKSMKEMESERKRFMMANVYGMHAPLKLRMEEEILGSFRRLPGLHSSFVGLDTLHNRDEDFDFSDYLADPRDSEMNTPDLHTTMEKRLGISMPRLAP
mmetsp:Transcript_23364/g.38431  ORF Transcript_23364/g.38431 Transcript_23364/m.38431 type:complete len:135 (-) Transcript_23364:173-577(-)